MKICINKTQLKNLLEILTEKQIKDRSVSDFVEIELIEKNEGHLVCDKLKFTAKDTNSQNENHFLGRGYL